MPAHGFRFSFTPLSGVLFTFPSRYLSSIGLPGVLSLGGWCRLLRTGLLRPRPTQGTGSVRFGFAYGAVTLYGPPFQARSAASALPSRPPFNPGRASTPPVWAGPLSLAATRGVTLVFLSSDYWDVSVRRVRLHYLWMPRPRAAGCPIRTSADPWLLAPPRGLSRPAASFLASGSQGILRAPSLACRRSAASPAAAASSFVSSRLARRPLGAACLYRRIAAPAAPASRPARRSLSYCRMCCSYCLLSFHPVKEPGGASPASCGECGARTHDPRLAKPVL